MRRAIALLAFIATAHAEDGGGSWWSRPAVRACCSDADAVFADDWRTDGTDVLATVTGGGPREHSWAPVGREYRIHAEKVIREPGNPSGRAILFINPHTLDAFCFIPGPLT